MSNERRRFSVNMKILSVDETDLRMAKYMSDHLRLCNSTAKLTQAVLEIAHGLQERCVPSVMTAFGFTSPDKEVADLLLQCYCILLDNYCFSVFSPEDWADFGDLSFYECHKRALKWSKMASELPGISRWNEYHEIDKDECSLN